MDAKANFRMRSRRFAPLNPEDHLTPALSPTPWRRGRRNCALGYEMLVGAEGESRFCAGIFLEIYFGGHCLLFVLVPARIEESFEFSGDGGIGLDGGVAEQCGDDEEQIFQ